MPSKHRPVPIIAFVSFVFAAVLVAGSAQAAPQIVAAVPTVEEVELACAGGGCSAEFSTICLQQSRTPPTRDTAYGLHGPERAAVAFTGYRKDGAAVALAPELLRFDSYRGHSAFRFSVPSRFLKDRGLSRLTVKVERLAMLLPVPEAGDPKPQTADDVTLALSEVETTGRYWAARNGENMAMARLTNRIINRLPQQGSISTEDSETLWQRALAPEKGLTGEPLAWNRRYVDYCRENALSPGSFSMRHCLGNAHDWFLKDLNTDYWKSLKPTS
ncbi:MAG: hypothetical protein CMM60_06905 [Rhodospirillaceae bacterium]|jgi:hypothetical protein|nr:hypothetical protein [Rhodospirillaceae bacterium]|tara:strand:- start:1031 stop:1849 length:819 start_codon:yes stop_codon:yes gene_type:complete